MAPAIPVLMAIGTAVSAVSAIQQGRAKKKALEQSAAIEQRNAALEAEMTAQRIRQEKRRGVLLHGKIAAQAGARAMGRAGSALDVIGDVMGQNQLQIDYLQKAGATRVESAQMRAQAKLSDASAAGKAGFLSAASELLGGGARTVDAYERVN